MSSFKSKLNRILKDVLHKGPVIKPRDRNFNKLLITNTIAEEPGCYIRISTTDQENAKDAKTIIDENKQELGIEDARIIKEPPEFFYGSKSTTDVPCYNSSVLCRVNTRLLFREILATADSNFRSLRSCVLDSDQENQQIVIDFSSPNIAKPFHYGHLRSTILGNYLTNLYQLLGHQVTKLNYIGDWGTQYGLLSHGLDLEPDLDNEISNNSGSYLRHLLDVYVKSYDQGRNDDAFFREAKRKFQEMSENTDSMQYRRWRRIRDLSLQELMSSYKRLDIDFDVYNYESDYAKSSAAILNIMEAKNLAFHHEDGSIFGKVLKNGKLLDVCLQKSDGSSLYLSRDIAAAIDRMERFNFDKMLYVVGSDQERHFHSLKELIGQLGYNWHDRLIHVKLGKVLNMSSRLGKSILLSDIIDEASIQFYLVTKTVPTSKVSKSDEQALKEVARHLAISSLFVYDMRQSRTKNYPFEWTEIMQTDYKSGINLQTTYARLSSLLDKNARDGFKPLTNEECQDDSLLNMESISCQEAYNLLSALNMLDVSLHASYWNMDSGPSVNYAIRLCKTINRARQSRDLMVTYEPDERKKRTRLALFETARKHLEMLIKLIGLKPLCKV